MQLLPGLHTLSLRKNKITSVGAMAIFTRIWESGKSNLSSLCLDGNEIGIEGAMSLSQALPMMKSLKTLSVSDNPLSDIGVYYILRALLNHKRSAYTNFPTPETLMNHEQVTIFGHLAYFDTIFIVANMFYRSIGED